MKKISVLAMLLSLAFSLSACAISSGESSGNGETESKESSSVIDSEEEASLQESASESVKEDEEKTYYTVSFDTEGGEEVDSVRVLCGQKLTKPEDPVKSTQKCEYIFEGWFFGDEEWNFEEDAVTQDMTLVAHWKEGESYTKPFLPKD